MFCNKTLHDGDINNHFPVRYRDHEQRKKVSDISNTAFSRKPKKTVSGKKILYWVATADKKYTKEA